MLKSQKIDFFEHRFEQLSRYIQGEEVVIENVGAMNKVGTETWTINA